MAVAGGLATGSFVAGFLHGFQLFLAIPVDVGIPFGGLGFVGGVVAVGLWLYLLHTVVLVGWAATARARAAAPRGRRWRREPVVDLRVWGVERASRRRCCGWPPAAATCAARPGCASPSSSAPAPGRTFTPRDADPHHWALLTVWDDEAGRRPRAPTRGSLDAWDDAAAERLVVRMTPLTAARALVGARAVRRSTPPAPARRRRAGRRHHPGPAAPARALSFWRAVPPVVDDLAARARAAARPRHRRGARRCCRAPSRCGTPPRTSIDFAYRSAAHREAVARTEPARWYAEELFARFAVRDVSGTYRGRQP